MIDLALVKERVDATPFRKFKLETTGGKQIQIVTRDHLLFAPESRELIIAFEPGGQYASSFHGSNSIIRGGNVA